MLTGNPIPQLGLGSTMEDGSYLLDKLDQIVTELGFKEYTTNKRLSLFNMFFYSTKVIIMVLTVIDFLNNRKMS